MLQVQGMIAAEHQLTEHLKVTHLQIDEQLLQLRDQLKVGWAEELVHVFVCSFEVLGRCFEDAAV